ncbi:hypothetical protein ACHAWO_008970 [Cyclotella atomus]|uniref:Uncharacterized protein n=1 Tax=Cyclotella atomus TaxID=382360 RepID=A0ABD3NEN2_9STRA
MCCNGVGFRQRKPCSDDPPYSEALYFQANDQLQLTSGVRIEPLLGESCSHVKCSNNKAIEFNEGCYLKAVDLCMNLPDYCCH